MNVLLKKKDLYIMQWFGMSGFEACNKYNESYSDLE